MAREVVISCDVCGHSPAKTYTIEVEGAHYRVDLDSEHAAPLIAIAEKGTRTSSTRVDGNQNKSLNRRIRGLPSASPET